MRRVFVWNNNTDKTDIFNLLNKYMPSLINEQPYYETNIAPTFLTAYKQAMADEHNVIIIPFHNVFKNLILVVGKVYE